MACCSGCVGYPAAEEQFGTASAQRDLNSYRRKGPDPSSGLLLKAVANEVRHGDSLLDVGGGVGVLTFELLARGVDHATLVDASSAYLNAAQLEASRRDLKHRLIIVHGDVVHLDGAIAAADVVTMHRVICCYSEWTALLNRATQLSRRLLALSYPRDKWYIRSGSHSTIFAVVCLVTRSERSSIALWRWTTTSGQWGLRASPNAKPQSGR